MIHVWKGCLIALSMYSKIPVPVVEWEEDSLKYSLCFFPLVGLLVLGLWNGWWYLSKWLFVGPVLKNTMLFVLPLAVTGGIHLDGFLDTEDARNSYQPKEKKLEILKDPHIGAFGMIRTLMYTLVSLGLLFEIKDGRILFLASLGFLASRAFSALSFVMLKPAKTSGLFYEFSRAADKRSVKLTCLFVLASLILPLLIYEPLFGCLAFFGAFLIFYYYRGTARKEFGGVTGDLAGYFLILCELWFLAAAVITGLIERSFTIFM